MDIGLYVHIPFCAIRCGYCDFYTLGASQQSHALHQAYVEAVLAELGRARKEVAVKLDTVFIGGGTPSMLSERLLDRLLAGIRDDGGDRPPREFTVEANPASLTRVKAEVLRRHGVNRISLGAQSFNTAELRQLDRLHAPGSIESTASLVRSAGFEHLNLDLIFGIPGQTMSSWHESLDRAVQCGADHLSCYGLTYEPGTPLHLRRTEGRVVPMEEGLEADMYLGMIDRLASAGFEHYEISNFARPGARCLHNLRYWHQEPGLGIGPSAAGYLDGRRWQNVPDIDEYIRRVRAGRLPRREEETLSPWERAGELAILQLRLIDGMDTYWFRERTGFDPHEWFASAIGPHAEAGRLIVSPNRLRLSRQGLLVADIVMSDFLSCQEVDAARRAAG